MSIVEPEENENEVTIYILEHGTNAINLHPHTKGVKISDLVDILGKGKMAVMKIMPMRHTPFTLSKDHNYILDVDEGHGKVQLHLATSSLKKNTTILVPKGVAFSITNTSKTEPLIVTCIQLK